MISRRFVSEMIKRVMRPHKREDGQVIIMVGLATIVLFGVVGLAVDVGRLYIMKAELSRAMDAAALAGVLELPDAAKATAACEEYLLKNEPGIQAVAGSGGVLCDSPGENTLRVRGRKEITMFFIGVLGIDDAGVSAKAKAGFGVAFLDAVLVLDETSSMADPPCTSGTDNTTSGCPIKEAKAAAKAFKDVLLGPSPDGNTVIGITGFRGCYRDDTSPSTNSTAPKPNSATNCTPDHGSASTSHVIAMQSNSSDLGTKIDQMSALGGSGTNVCNGMLKGWEVLNGPANHQGQANALKYMILLSDGDNNYNGAYSYQSSPYASPHTYNGYSCMPDSSCSNVGGDSSSTPLCHSGVYGGITNPSDGFDYSVPPWTGGSNWTGPWVPNSATTTIVGTNTTSPQAGTRRLLLGRGGSPAVNGSIYRTFSLANHSTANLSFYVRRNSNFTGTDQVRVQISTDGTTWTTLRTFTGTSGSATGSWTSYPTNSLNSYVGQSTLYLRLHVQSMDNTADQFYFDTVSITGSGSSDGYLNGQDSSPSCSGTAAKRERQLDMKTLALAQALEADGVEIYVVSFGACATNSTVYTDAQCQPYTVSGGLIGNTDNDNTSDQRLAKCIATSKTGTNDHWFYASSASGLPAIFTQIAKQIAHRLIE
ncbi:MAG TPA: pilus assembly protein TadG-related protein [Dehalococcoidia bacterium]|nr:pilus assembly protein TadG-related protein [Dehalococcoidia bacterium]